jgi:hydroxymethylbilane synthase
VKLRIGTRGSLLARWQADWVASQLRKLAGAEVEVIEIRTQGDARIESISGLSGQGVFTREIQVALLDRRIDLAVHSLKDLPTDGVEGLQLSAIPVRESVGDALISVAGASLAKLPAGATIGTGSIRRRAQLLHARPDLRMADIRGNVDTRLRKLRDGEFAAIVLAEAGLRRLGLDGEITEVLPPTVMLPAVGQGALGIETRVDDPQTIAAAKHLNHSPSQLAVLAERALLAELRGGCLAPIGAWARLEGATLQLSAAVLSADGRERLLAQACSVPDQATELGHRVAAQLRAQGADRLVDQSRKAP